MQTYREVESFFYELSEPVKEPRHMSHVAERCREPTELPVSLHQFQLLASLLILSIARRAHPPMPILHDL
jgi:hypothetical protein